VGHVPTRPVRLLGEGRHLQGRQRRGAAREGALTADSRAARARQLGRRGEDLAARWYEDHGWEILATNWRCAEGELDLVCRRGRTVAFCEVKARSDGRFGSPFEALGPAKQRRLRRLAVRFLAESRAGAGVVRFDVASVLGGELVVLEGAFG
jgi:putative endonuclease